MVDVRANATTDLGTTIRFFVSSTFSEFGRERGLLQRQVFPLLRQQCLQAGFRFQPIDLRWGVSAAASAERQTLRICFEELARCQERSPDFCLLILLGDRYGTCFLPEQVPADQVRRLRLYLSGEDQQSLDAAYVLDENAVLPDYVLRQIERTSESAAQQEESLRQALARAAEEAHFSEQDQLPFLGSATHREIHQGLLAPGQTPAGVLAAFRTTPPSPGGTQATLFNQQDAAGLARLTELKRAVEEKLPTEQVLRYTVPWETTRVPYEDTVDETAQEEPLATQFLHFLEPRVQAVIAARRHGQQTRDLVALANAKFARQRAEHVEGRDGELAQIMGYLASDTPLPLVVTGAPGSGKSTLLAAVAERLATDLSSTVVVTRYIGVTPGTSTLYDLLSGVRLELARATGQNAPEPLTDLSQLVHAVSEQLHTMHVSEGGLLILLLDAFDQLSAQPQRVDWPPRTLAPHVRMVVSILAARQELTDLGSWLPEGQVLTVGPLGQEAGRAVLRQWLAQDGRTLTAGQEQHVLTAFAREGSPLYLRVAEEAARRWRSFEEPPVLETTTAGLLAARLDQLERPAEHGQALVRHALGDLAAARDGLVEDELLEVLARDQQVRASLHDLNPGAPAINPTLPLPVVLWARLHADLERLLTEREADGVRLLTFYHSQVRTVVNERCLGAEIASDRHQNLAAYFGSQPWHLSTGVWNQRKLAE